MSAENVPVIGELVAAEDVGGFYASFTFHTKWPTPGIEWVIGATYAISFNAPYVPRAVDQKISKPGETLPISAEVAS